ncbi:hypothetical protein FACS189431_6530 [Alphaproteobacteria bacterium]|nr:hypothetical protein FACS189431_6530 [Alphaproteobacteria bacterium]
MTNLKELLESVKGITKENANGKFCAIAKELFSNYEIQKGDKHYDFLEIEFYYYSENHPDENTYPREAKVGEWFTHLSGVDIAFDSDSMEYGGILVRSIVEHGKKDQPICGPLKTMIHLFNHIPSDSEISDKYPIIKRIEVSNDFHIDPTIRFNIKDIREYCFYNSDESIKWGNHPAKPSNRKIPKN